MPSTSDKPVLVIQLRPEDETSDHEFGAILRYGGLAPERARRLRAEQSGLPEDLSLDDYSAIVVGGSPFDISTPEEQKSAIQREVEAGFDRLLARVVAADFPFLGCCSGNGLLGSHLAAGISGRYAEPVSGRSVEITAEGKQDKLLAGFPYAIDVLLGHKEACDELPQGAELLVTSRDCPVQMFRVGDNVYATQFHPEGDAEGFAVRIDAYRHHGYFEPDEADRLIEDVSARQTPYAQEILRRFVAFYLRGSNP